MARRARRTPYRYRRDTPLMKYTFGYRTKDTIIVRVALARKVAPACRNIVYCCSDGVTNFGGGLLYGRTQP